MLLLKLLKLLQKAQNNLMRYIVKEANILLASFAVLCNVFSVKQGGNVVHSTLIYYLCAKELFV